MVNIRSLIFFSSTIFVIWCLDDLIILPNPFGFSLYDVTKLISDLEFICLSNNLSIVAEVIRGTSAYKTKVFIELFISDLAFIKAPEVPSAVFCSINFIFLLFIELTISLELGGIIT